MKSLHAVMMCLMVFLVECPAAETVPPVSSMTAGYQTGRKVWITFVYGTLPGTVLSCDIYRDGQFLYSGVLGQKDAETNGATWYGQSGNKQYFLDSTLFPGREHVYTFVTRTGDGASSEPVEWVYAAGKLPFAISQPNPRTGRTIDITITTPVNVTFFPDVFYTVYRDDELLATIPPWGSGTTDAGDTWTWSGTASMRFSDNNAFPGRVHRYRVAAHPFEGFTVEYAAAGRIHLPAFALGTLIHSGYRSVQIPVSTPISTSDFPNLRYEVHRDGEKIGELPTTGSGTLDNGDEYGSINYGRYYKDKNITPGQMHEYRIVATLFPSCQMELTGRIRTRLPSFSITGHRYFNGTVSLDFTSALTPDNFPGAYYEVRRDGESIGVFSTGGVGQTLENGNRWSYAVTGTRTFHDVHALPGQIYHYRLSAHLMDGLSLHRDLLVTVNPPVVNVSASRTNASTGQLELERTIHGFTPLYTVYRDGVKRAEFFGYSSGNGENCFWSYNNVSYKQYFTETNLEPDRNYVYRVVASFADGIEIEGEGFLDVHAGSVGNNSGFIVNDAYVPIIRRLPTGEYMLGVSLTHDPDEPGADIRVFIGGGNYIFLDNGGIETTIPAREFAVNGLANRYFIAPASINPNRAIVNIYAAKAPNGDSGVSPEPPSAGN